MAKKEINGHTYIVEPHPVREIQGFARRFAALASGPVLSMLGGAAESGEGMDMELSKLDSKDIQESLLFLVDNISDDELDQLFEYTRRDGAPLANEVNYNEAFKGKWADWYKVLVFILRTNGFLDFLSSP